ncbi:MAG: Na+/H+ antiporter [Solirubrobacteraceae bacterium]
MINADLVIALLAAITLLAGLAARTGTPYPVVLVLGGLVMGLVPGVPSPALNPDLVLVLFLPPLIYSSAFLSSVSDIRANAAPILALAIGLVLVTTGLVAGVAVLVVGLPVAVALVLGAVLGPTDPVSASAILYRVGAPERLVTVLEGESLVNDATAITAYALAIDAVRSGHFQWLNGIGRFAFEVVVGTAIGLAVAWLALRLRRALRGTGPVLALTLLTPFVAYIPAQALRASGVLAVVAAGLYASATGADVDPARTRLQVRTFWELMVFLLNALLFLLIGMELTYVISAIGGGLSAALVGQALAVGATLIGVRLVWMFVVPAVTSALRHGEEATEARPATRFVLGWSGMRGGVSLALALAIPLTVPGGSHFPHRSTVIFLAYAAVLLTLVPAGLTLGPLINRLGLGQGAVRRRQLAEAQASVLHAALEELEALASDARMGEAEAERLRALYESRLERVTSRVRADDTEPMLADEQVRVRASIIAAERRQLAQLRTQHAYPAAVLREVGHQLDLDEARGR